MTSQLNVAIGSLAHGALEGAPGPTRVLDLGPEHPSRTGLVLARLELDDGHVTSARIQPGLNHRSAEKLFEVRDYRQVLVLADRHDWQAPFTGELGIALACEHLMGLVPPQRATWLRMLLAEQARISSHLAHLSFVPYRCGEQELARRVRALRSEGRELLWRTSGNRVHPMMNRLGGLAADVEAALVDELVDWAARAADCANLLAGCVQQHELGRGLAVLGQDVVDSHSLSGPVSAASGVPRCLRASNSYLAYGDVAELLPAAPSTEGDAMARFLALCAEVDSSARIMAACAESLRTIPGPVDTPLSKIVKLPESEAYLALDAPWGSAGFHLVSRAERTPWRLHLRTPSFANVQALQQALLGCPQDHLEVAFASLGWTSGDLDK